MLTYITQAENEKGWKRGEILTEFLKWLSTNISAKKYVYADFKKFDILFDVGPKGEKEILIFEHESRNCFRFLTCCFDHSIQSYKLKILIDRRGDKLIYMDYAVTKESLEFVKSHLGYLSREIYQNIPHHYGKVCELW